MIDFKWRLIYGSVWQLCCACGNHDAYGEWWYIFYIFKKENIFYIFSFFLNINGSFSILFLLLSLFFPNLPCYEPYQLLFVATFLPLPLTPPMHCQKAPMGSFLVIFSAIPIALPSNLRAITFHNFSTNQKWTTTPPFPTMVTITKEEHKKYIQ